jgi:hypothetical protein
MNSLIFSVGIVVLLGILGYSWVIADQVMIRAMSIPSSKVARDVRWYRQLVYRIFLIGIAAVPAVILGNMLISVPFQTLTYGGLNGAKNPALENLEGCSEGGVDLLITMRGLDTAQDTAEADISLCVGDQVLRNLTLDGSLARPLSKGPLESRPGAAFLESKFSVSYLGSTPEESLTRTVSIGSILNQANSDGIQGPVDLGPITIPLVGSAMGYPLDSYSSSGIWTVSLPSNMRVVTGRSIQFSWAPAPIEVAALPDADNISWQWGYVHTLGDVLQASRVSSLRYFVLLVAGLPLLLFIGLLALVRPIVNDASRRRFPAELLVGVGAFLLAIIPIRTVLVPSDISQITVTDYILGTEMTVMVASSLMIVLAGSIKPRSQGLADSARAFRNDTADTIPPAMYSATRINREADPSSPKYAGAISKIILAAFAGVVSLIEIRRRLKRRDRTEPEA